MFMYNVVGLHCNCLIFRVEGRFRSVFPDCLEVATAVVVLRGVGKASPRRNSVDISYSGPSGILGSDGKQNTA